MATEQNDLAKRLKKELLIQRALDTYNTRPGGRLYGNYNSGFAPIVQTLNDLLTHVQKQDQVILDLVAYVADTAFKDKD